MAAVTAMRLTTMAIPVSFQVRAMHKKIDVEGSDDDSNDRARSLVDSRMAERNAKIRKCKLKRLGLDDSDEEESEEM
jgi:hypothetical protein